jgi:hypothetical protein
MTKHNGNAIKPPIVVERLVREALANAAANGYEDDMRRKTADELTTDLMDYDAALEGQIFSVVRIYAEAWLRAGRQA